MSHLLKDCDPNRFVCFICKATALARQANGLSGPAIEEGLCPLVSTEIEVRRDLTARHIVDDSPKGPGITRRAYEALNWPYYSAHKLRFRRIPFGANVDEQIFLWHHGFGCLYATFAPGASCVIPCVFSDRYWEKSHPSSSAADRLVRKYPIFSLRVSHVVDLPAANDLGISITLTDEAKKEPEDEIKYVSIETTTLDERVWTAPRYSVEPRFYSHLSVERTSHLQNEDINSSRWTDELNHFTRPRQTNELASPAGLRLSNELHNNVSMGTPGRSPAPLIKASPSMSNVLLHDVPSAMGSPAQPIEDILSMDSDFRLFDAQQRRANTQSSAHFDFPKNGESSQLRYRHNF